jgi:peroxiredoxin
MIESESELATMNIGSKLKLSIVAVSAVGAASLPAPANQDMGTDLGHITQQAQFGARRLGYIDCGRTAELELLQKKLPTWEPSEAIKAMLGTTAPEFADDIKWVNCQPLKLSKLRGHPVFIRFWYRNCWMCQVSAPLLNQLYDEYAGKGLVVIGVHHSKTTRGDSVAEVADAARSLGYRFPIAIDNSWNTIERFWIHSTAREYSSASFLIDANGTIVWGHDLGRLEKDTPAAVSLHKAIDALLNKPTNVSWRKSPQ